MNTKPHIVFLFYDHMTALDAIGPHEVLSRLPGAVVQRVAKSLGPVKSDSSGLTLMAEYALSEVSKADVLVIPGAGTATDLRNDPETLDWIRMLHTQTLWTTSVCTGSLILGATGLLSGLAATSHWAVLDRLSHYRAIPTAQRVVKAGKIITAAGVSAGIDMALLLAEKLSGKTVAETLQLAIEYDPEPPFHSGSLAKASPNIVEPLRTRLLSRFEPK